MCSKTQIAGRPVRTTWRVSSPRSVSETISPGCTSRISSAPMMSKRTALRGDHESLVQTTERERSHPVRVAKGDDRMLGHHHRRVGALQAWHHLRHRVLDEPAGVRGEQRRDDLGV